MAPYLGHDAPTVRPDSGGWVQVSTRRYLSLSLLNAMGIRALNRIPVLFFNRPKEFDDALQAQSYSIRLNESLSPRPYQQTLANLQMPVSVWVGEQDEAFYADRFAETIHAQLPTAQVVVLPQARHLDLPSHGSLAEQMTTRLGVLID